MTENDRHLACVEENMRNILVRLVAALVITGMVLGTPVHAAVTYKRGTLVITQGSTKVTLDVDVADSVESREQGLMNRTSMAENAGMLFVFEVSDVYAFWMKNTLIPLTVAFIDKNWEIVDLVDMAVAPDPHNGPFQIYKAAKPARYALEVNQGFFQRHNLTVGATVQYTSH